MYYDGAYAPFGEPYAQSGTTNLNFTGMNQDTTSGLYDFPAREYSIQGRWSSPDPAGLRAVSLSNPQTWNRYAYVTNNPLKLTDPSGLGSSCKTCVPPPTGFGGGTAGTGAASFGFGPYPDANVQYGYDVFDAIPGSPGTYLHYNMYGQMSFGFSEELYRTVGSLNSLGVNSLNLTGWTYVVRDLGTDSTASGFLADKIAHQNEQSWLNATLPGSVDTITAHINDDIQGMINRGANPANIYPAKIIANEVSDYVQTNGLDAYWEQVLSHYFINAGSTFPPQP